MTAELKFVRQQGFVGATPEVGRDLYAALMWQPRAIAALTLAGLVLQAGPCFLGLWALLWWNAAVPSRNPFDALYNSLWAKPKGLPLLGPAPAPRRAAQAEAGTLMLAIGLSLLTGGHALAWVLEAVLVASLAALLLGRLCLGSYLFLLFAGQGAFANQTLPWSGPPQKA
jgi:hypothetical protein